MSASKFAQYSLDKYPEAVVISLESESRNVHNGHTEQRRTAQNSAEHTEHTHKPKAMKPSHTKAFQVTSNQDGIKKVPPELFLDIKFSKINFFFSKITFWWRILVRICFRCVHM